ncbi:MAG: ABC transporter substrate-binding protein [Rhizobiales bacterium]|nr:ABC transporter substrate-binding protein [Rhizobacter sp.]
MSSNDHPHCLDPCRRRVLLAAGAALAMPASYANAQPRAVGERIRLAHWLDASPDQQEISRDYATGVRLAVNDFNRGAKRAVQLVNFESDGSPASVRNTVQTIRKDPTLCALIGTAGERLALDSIEAARAEGLQIAHIAPWLSDSRYDRDRDVVTLFASREAQIRHALKNLESMGIGDIGLVYSSEREFASLHTGVELAAGALKLRSVVFAPKASEDIAALATRVATSSPVVLLFLGETIELSQFAQALSTRRVQRYVVSLADIDVGMLVQLGAGRSLPMILTQVVPNPQTSNVPAVRDYRALLKAQFDEKPSHISLAGYLGARYAMQSLAGIDRAVTREAVLEAIGQRTSIDVGGFQLGFSAQQRRGSTYVTQTLLTSDGRMVG